MEVIGVLCEAIGNALGRGARLNVLRRFQGRALTVEGMVTLETLPS